MRTTFAQRSAPGIASAVAVFELAGDIDAACEAIGFTAPTVGKAALRTVPSVDTLLAIRPSEAVLLLTPHGGVQVCRALSRAMLDADLTHNDADPAWPEASSDIEARMLTALGDVRGERAVAHLLSQPARWVADAEEVPPDVGLELSRLLHPPLVVATGPANVGKSSLTNALAGRTVARVADRPGVTRDAVAVDLELDEMVVRWLDAPGVDLSDDAVLAEAQALAKHAIDAADLVLWCEDAAKETPSVPANLVTSLAGSGGESRIMIATRDDLNPGRPPRWADAAVSTVTGQGLPELTRLVRRRLVSDAALANPGAWAFWRPAP